MQFITVYRRNTESDTGNTAETVILSTTLSLARFCLNYVVSASRLYCCFRLSLPVCRRGQKNVDKLQFGTFVAFITVIKPIAPL